MPPTSNQMLGLSKLKHTSGKGSCSRAQPIVSQRKLVAAIGMGVVGSDPKNVGKVVGNESGELTRQRHTSELVGGLCCHRSLSGWNSLRKRNGMEKRKVGEINRHSAAVLLGS